MSDIGTTNAGTGGDHRGTVLVGLVLAVAALVLGALAVAGLGQSATPSVTPAAAAASAATAAANCGGAVPKMTVHGTGTASGTPDLLTLSLSVDVTDATAQQALADDNTRTAAVVGALTSGGVTKPDVQTTGLSINPNYDYQNGTPELTGYAVNNSVVAKLRDFTTAGAVIDSASTAGGNAVQISSLSFSIADPRPLQDEARRDAVAQAVSHAAAMAATAGDTLGPVCSLTDQSSQVSEPQNEDFAAASGVGSPGSAVPVEAGSQQASAQVTLVYRLEPRRALAPGPRAQ